MRALVRGLVRAKQQVRGHISEWTSAPRSTGDKTAGQSTKTPDRSAVPLRGVVDRTTTPDGEAAEIRELIAEAKAAKAAKEAERAKKVTK